jgi:uracil-DNA glycosylase family 4
VSILAFLGRSFMAKKGSPADANLSGEQPGDQEDRQGAPFVGPAGAMLGKAVADLKVMARALRSDR